uniref:Uncharacterized protein n=1 Tax=Aegilops tauschii subsp. strangulata TaxID=200361 RepID=A0A453IU48_AEGTS
MEGSSTMSPLGEPVGAKIAACAPALSGEHIGLRKYVDVPNILLIPCVLFAKKLFVAVESVNSVQNQDFSDATSFPEINSPMLLIDDFSTPKKKQSF